jgi:hypothetical protein
LVVKDLAVSVTSVKISDDQCVLAAPIGRRADCSKLIEPHHVKWSLGSAMGVALVTHRFRA